MRVLTFLLCFYLNYSDMFFIVYIYFSFHFSVMAIYPSANMQDSGVKNNRMNVLFSQAKRMEEMMFHQASSRVCHFVIRICVCTLESNITCNLPTNHKGD